MKLRSLLTALAVGGAVLSMPVAATAGPYNAAYLFGDSLSDSGNTFNATGGAIPPSPPYFNGRFSNGPVWSEILFGRLGLAPPKVTALPGPSVADGIDFAFGGATTGTFNVLNPSLPPPGLPGMRGQVTQFGNLTGGGALARPGALYILWGGANDYLGGGITDPTVPVGNLSSMIADLYGFGARDFLVLNLPDLGETPAARNNPDPLVSAGLTALTLGHNALLEAALGGFAVLPDINLLTFDSFSLFEQTLLDPAAFGFTNVTDSCLTAVSVCAAPNEYLFWDGIHPTAAGHAIVAARVAAAIPEPATLVLFGFGLAALGLTRRRAAVS